MSLNKTQQITILTLYARQLEAGRSHKARTALLEEIYETFNSSIPEWREKLRTILTENGFNVAIMTLDRFTEEEKKRFTAVANIATDSVYTPPIELEREEAFKEYQEKLVSYAFFMMCVKRCVIEDIISVDEYSRVERAIADHYGIIEFTAERIIEPFLRASDSDNNGHARNTKYTKHNTEYWEHFSASNKRTGNNETDGRNETKN